MKIKILEILRSKEEAISGEYISSLTGVSRVSIWKHIKNLKNLGYDILSSPKGYELKNDKDTLSPWEFKKREKSIHYFEELDSTMNHAKIMARKGCPHFTVVIAEKQTKGRGRLDRVWKSEKGGLFFTVILKPDINPCFAFLFNFAASLSMCEILEEKTKIEVKTKWPNDLLVNEKKLVGILSEIETEADTISFLNIGIGLNVNNTVSEYEKGAVSLKEIAGKEFFRKEILSLFLDRFEKRINEKALYGIISEWKKKSVTIGRNVKIATHNNVYEGLALDVDDSGALLLKLKSGDSKKIIYGDCFLTDSLNFKEIKRVAADAVFPNNK